MTADRPAAERLSYADLERENRALRGDLASATSALRAERAVRKSLEMRQARGFDLAQEMFEANNVLYRQIQDLYSRCLSLEAKLKRTAA